MQIKNITGTEHHIKGLDTGKHFSDPHVDAIRSPEVRDQPVSAGWDEGKANIKTRPGYHL